MTLLLGDERVSLLIGWRMRTGGESRASMNLMDGSDLAGSGVATWVEVGFLIDCVSKQGQNDAKMKIDIKNVHF